MNNNKYYDPSWLIEAAEKYAKEYPWLVEELKKCTSVVKETTAYIYFVSPDNPNKLGSRWQIKENISLQSESHGEIVLDILENNKIGGVEFIDKLE